VSHPPAVIIGAPRSGTNMLRDALCAVDGVATWPCDEINYIWRHGNLRYPTDELPEHLATSSVRSYIRSQFEWVSKRYSATTVVEKTCANSLRVPFVDRVIPNARYVFVIRDGIDVVGSANLRWRGDAGLVYILKKARFVPKPDIPYYAASFLQSRLHRIRSSERRAGSWGPVFDGMTELLQGTSLNEICLRQWQRCVNLAADALADLPADRVMLVRYEQFVQAPEQGLEMVLRFLNIEAADQEIGRSVAGVSSSSIGKGRRQLDPQEVDSLEPRVAATLSRFE